MDLFTLVARLTLDKSEYSEGINEAGAEAQEAANNMKRSFMVMAGAGAAAFVAVGKSAVDAYGNYEQLVGGAELMFGDAFKFVEERSKQAYKNVQMNQNDYLRQVNGFATGLKTALGGNEQAAAELADRIVTAEADVVAATGNTQEAVQNAFNGIMKGNFTMLDNLQLGIKPTKEGFQEVIDKVNEWNKANGEATNYQIDNLADAQSALVDYIEMQGLAGYAQQEAADTIQGSLASLKGAWQDQLTILGEKFAPMVKDLIRFVTDLVENFDKVAPIVAGVAVAFGTFAVAINIGTLIESVTTSFAAFNAILAANPIGLVIAAIAGLVAWFVILYNNNEEFRNKVNEVWIIVQDTITNVINAITAKFEEIKAKVTEAMNAFEDFKNKVSSAITTAKDTFTNGINAMKNALNFSWKLPDLKIPHISVSGGEAPYGLGGKGSLPQFSIQWYRKAYDDPIMFTNPTVIPTAYGLKGFGDGPGAEVVMSMDKLRQMTGGYTQNLYFYSSEPADPSEIARQTRNANREAVLALKGLR